MMEKEKMRIVIEFGKIKGIADYISTQFPHLRAESILPIATAIY